MDVYYAAPYSGDKNDDRFQFNIPAVKKEPYSTLASYTEQTIIKKKSNKFTNDLFGGSKPEETCRHSMPLLTDRAAHSESHQHGNTMSTVDIARRLDMPPAFRGSLLSKLPIVNLVTEGKLPSTSTSSTDVQINNKPLANNRLLPPTNVTWCNQTNSPNFVMMTSSPTSISNQSTEQLYNNMTNSFYQAANFNDLAQLNLIPHINILHENHNNSPSSQIRTVEKHHNNCLDQMAYKYLSCRDPAFLQSGANFSASCLGSNMLQQRQSTAPRHGSVSTSDASEISPAGNISVSGEQTSSSNTVTKQKSKHPIHLWEFLKQLLIEGRDGIRWIDRSQGVFKICNSQQIAKYWGERKNRPAMNYDKLSRSIRQYYKKGIIRKTTQGKRLVYQFCPAYR